MRTFIAIDLPEEVKTSIRAIQQQLFEGETGVTLTKDFHITLKFLGEVDDVKAMNDKLQTINFKPFTAKLSGLGVFPSPGYIRVAWVGVQAPEIAELHTKIDDALIQQFPRDTKFTTHITLARVKLLKDKAAFIAKMGNTSVPDSNFPVDCFMLKKSTLTPQGPVYEDL